MSVEAFSWALRVPVGGNMKIMLLGLANHAHPDGSDARPALDTLAIYGHCDRSTAKRNVRKLEEARWIRDDGVDYMGRRRWVLAMTEDPFPEGGGKSPPGAGAPPTGGHSDGSGGAPAPPEPSHEPSSNRVGEKSAREERRHQVPEDFPDELRVHARVVMGVLRGVAKDHGAREVTAQALGNVMMSRPRKPLVKIAYDLAAWAPTADRTIRDVVATYRTWLDRQTDLAATEHLDDQGRPADPRTGRLRVVPNGGTSSGPSATISDMEKRAAELREQGQ